LAAEKFFLCRQFGLTAGAAGADYTTILGTGAVQPLGAGGTEGAGFDIVNHTRRQAA